MSPNNEAVRTGEYGIIDEITCLDHWPELKYWEERPGRKCLIVDDIGWGLSKRGSPSQFELADRTVGHNDFAPQSFYIILYPTYGPTSGSTQNSGNVTAKMAN